MGGKDQAFSPEDRLAKRLEWEGLAFQVYCSRRNKVSGTDAIRHTQAPLMKVGRTGVTLNRLKNVTCEGDENGGTPSHCETIDYVQ